MKPRTWARVVLSPQAEAVKQAMTPAQRRRLRTLIDVIKNGPEDGLYAGEDADGDTLRQMTAANIHALYKVTFWPVGRALLIATIEIRDWEPLDDRPTMGTRSKR